MLAVATSAAVAAEYQMPSLATSVQPRQSRRGNAQVPRSALLHSLLRLQRFAATTLFRSFRWLQSVIGAAATRKALPSFIAGNGGGLSGSCASSLRWCVSRQLSKPMPLFFGSSHRWGSHRTVLPNPSLERDLHRHGTWPAKRSLSSSASRAKRHSGSGPSAQTLGLTYAPFP